MYGVVVMFAVCKPIGARLSVGAQCPPVTLLKPLCGTEPDSYRCLRSFFLQDCPQFQIVFGVSSSEDPAIDLVHRLQAEFPGQDVAIAVDRQLHGSNRKVSNLINMMAYARHDLLVVSDSDIQVQPDYLQRIVAPLLDAQVGIVTCLYRGVSRSGVWSSLGAQFINEWFIPSVCIAALFGSRSFAFGATIAVRREVLARVGGFASIVDQLADDYRLGEITRSLGLRTVLSEVMVDNIVVERSLKALLLHELRWLRTIRALRPISYGFCFVTFSLPVVALTTWLLGGANLAMLCLGVTAVARLVVHLKMNDWTIRPLRLALVPCRDVLSLCLWLWSFATRRVDWKDQRFHVGRDGSVQLVVRT